MVEYGKYHIAYLCARTCKLTLNVFSFNLFLNVLISFREATMLAKLGPV